MSDTAIAYALLVTGTLNILIAIGLVFEFVKLIRRKVFAKYYQKREYTIIAAIVMFFMNVVCGWFLIESAILKLCP